MKRKTVEDYYLESDNFEAWFIQRTNLYQIKTKSGRYIDCQNSKEGVKQSFAYYEQRKLLAESAGEYLETANFCAKLSDTRISHHIFRRDNGEIVECCHYGQNSENIVEALNRLEASLKEQR